MTRRRKPTDYQPRSSWQLIFLMSKANGADDHQEALPNHGWQWPQKTWLQSRMRRLEQIRREAR